MDTRLGMPYRCFSRFALVALASAVLSACQSMYFRPASDPPVVAHRVAELPFSEYWTGIVFNGEKIGFTHFKISRVPGPERQFEVVSEASFVLRFLGIEKKINLKARDLIAGDLTLRAFDYDYRIDGSELIQRGKRMGNELRVTVRSGGEPVERSHAAPEKLYPSSVIALYPAVHGLQVGRDFAYTIYDGQTQTIAEVRQRVEGYEASELFQGNAFKIATSLHGQKTTTWIDDRGRPVFELAMRGVMISALEDGEKAKRYVALGVLNREEALVEFSIVRPPAPLPEPRRVSRMVVELEGLDTLPPAEEWQQCERKEKLHVCEINLNRLSGISTARVQAKAEKYLAPSLTVQSAHASIRATARSIAPHERAPLDQVASIIQWLDRNIEKVPVDVFSALDVLQQKKAECQGHAYLYTALARALGIPSRVVNGLAYSEDLKGFLFHSWAESEVDGRWIPVDPTFGQTLADATHIKLLEGEMLSDLLPLINWVGKLKIRVLALEHRGT